jgi:gliding motility-associated-like protein
LNYQLPGYLYVITNPKLQSHKIGIANSYKANPNEDRLNDLFIKVWNFTPKDYKFTIYNRWGELLFETLDINAGWDCKFKGDLVQQDVYIYKITYYDTDKKWYEMRGTFFVVR